MQQGRWFNTALITGAAVLLAAAFSLPFVSSTFCLKLPGWLPNAIAGRVREYLIATARIPVGDHYLWGIIRDLFNAREFFVGTAILLFSIVFPCVKIILLAGLAVRGHRLSARLRQTCFSVLASAGKWSMADVFVVGMAIVFFKADGLHFAFTALAGAYCYAASAVLSSVGMTLVQRLHERSRQLA